MKTVLLFLTLFTVQNSWASSSDKNCLVSFDIDNSIVEGTGFKTTQKVGVAGKLLKFSLNKVEKKKDVKELLRGLVVTVDLMSVDSGNALRDRNLREGFFSLISENSEAKVAVKSVTDKEISAELSLNGKKQDLKFSYTITKDKLEAKGTFDVLNFAMNDAFSALKKRCGALHTGADGKSKTWSEFGLRVEAKLTSSCN